MKDVLHHIRRFTRQHRRGLAAACAAIAVYAILSSLSSSDRTIPVVVANQPVMAGSVLSDEVLEIRHYPETLVPDEAQSSTEGLVGSRIGSGLAQGEPVTTTRLAPSRSSVPGHVLVPVPLDDPSLASTIAVGDQVNIVAVYPQDEEPTLLARMVLVEAVTTTSEAGFSRTQIHVAVDEESAMSLVTATERAVLTVMIN